MIVVDTNILSTFARIQRLELLFAVAETDSLHLVPAVINELKLGLKKNLNFLQPIIDGLTSGTKFFPLPLMPDEKINQCLPETITFLKELIRIPSLSGQEKKSDSIYL